MKDGEDRPGPRLVAADRAPRFVRTSGVVFAGCRPLWPPRRRTRRAARYVRRDVRGSLAARCSEAFRHAIARALPTTVSRVNPEDAADFLTAGQLAQRLGVSRETVRRLAIAGTLPHTVVCRGTRKTTAATRGGSPRSSRPAAWRSQTWPPSPPPGGRGSPRPHRNRPPAAAPTWTCSTPGGANRQGPRGRCARGARSGSRAWSTR